LAEARPPTNIFCYLAENDVNQSALPPSWIIIRINDAQGDSLSSGLRSGACGALARRRSISSPMVA